MRRRASALAGAALAVLLTAAAASDPAVRLSDPAQEARARHLFQEVRCLVCQNESIDDSEAELAADLRKVVREQVRSGRTDADVRAFLVARYGDFVLLRPPFSLANALLWLTPFGLVVAGGSVLLLRRRPARLEPALTPEEERRLDDLSNAPVQGPT